MHLNFELDLYVAKLLIIVWIVLPYLALKHVMALKPSDNSWLGYIFFVPTLFDITTSCFGRYATSISSNIPNYLPNF